MRTKTILSSFCALFLAYTAHSGAWAGFEWVPPQQPKAEQQPDVMPAMPPASVEAAPVTPPPLGELSPSAIKEQEPQKLVGQSKDGSATATITLDAPAEGTLHTKTMGEPTSLAPQKLRMSDTLEAVEPAKPMLDTEDMKAEVSAPIPPMANEMRKPVNLLDAQPPAAAIAPAPVAVDAQPAVREMKETLPQNSQFPEVLGFGNNMPLAMALQQVVPPQYAYSFGSSVNPGAPVSWNGGRPWDLVLNDMLQSLGLKARMTGNTIMVIKALDNSAMIHNIPPQSSEIAEDDTILQPLTKKTATAPKKSSVAPYVRQDWEAPQPTNTANANDPVILKRTNIKDPGEAKASQSVTVTTPSSRLTQGLTIDPNPLKNQVAPPPVDKTWEAGNGDSLKDTLEKWAKTENVKLVWEASHDFALATNVYVSGSLRNAINVLVSNSLESDQKPIIHFVENGTNGLSTIIVKDPNPNTLKTG